MSDQALVALQPVASLVVETQAGPSFLAVTQQVGVFVAEARQGAAGRDGGVTEARAQELIDAAMKNSPVATIDHSGSVAAGQVASALAADPDRQILIISNTGSSPLTYRFDADPTEIAGHGLTSGEEVRFGAPACPRGELRIFSTAGTTFFVTAG